VDPDLRTWPPATALGVRHETTGQQVATMPRLNLHHDPFPLCPNEALAPSLVRNLYCVPLLVMRGSVPVIQASTT
jgi:hypothetical protein